MRQRLAYWIESAVYALTASAVTWLVFLLAGCAVFSSQQLETAKDGTTRETRIRVYTMFDAQSDLTKLRASTTEKTQGLTLAGLNETSSSTNLVEILRLVVALAAATAK